MEMKAWLLALSLLLFSAASNWPALRDQSAPKPPLEPSLIQPHDGTSDTPPNASYPSLHRSIKPYLGDRDAPLEMVASLANKDCTHCSTATPHSPEPPRPRLALLVSGRLLRFLFGSIALRVVAPNVASGADVDVFVQLAEGGFECPSKAKDRELRGRFRGRNWTLIELERTVRAGVEAAGGRLAHFSVSEQPYIHPQTNPDAGYSHLLWDEGYGRIQRCAESQAAFLRFEGWQAVMARELAENFTYTFVMATREDAHWLTDMAPISTFRTDGVSVKGCLRWKGINDKGALLPRRFTNAWLSYVVGLYITTVPRWYNLEDFLAKRAARIGATIHEVSPDLLPYLDARAPHTTRPGGGVEEGTPCIIAMYAGEGCECVPAGVDCATLPRCPLAWERQHNTLNNTPPVGMDGAGGGGKRRRRGR